MPVILGNPALISVPTALVPAPSINLFLRLGKLNVVLPSPEPYVVPITSNKFWYCVLLTAWPSHSKNPSGIALPAYGNTTPGINTIDFNNIPWLALNGLLVSVEVRLSTISVLSTFPSTLVFKESKSVNKVYLASASCFV